MAISTANKHSLLHLQRNLQYHSRWEASCKRARARNSLDSCRSPYLSYSWQGTESLCGLYLAGSRSTWPTRKQRWSLWAACTSSWPPRRQSWRIRSGWGRRAAPRSQFAAWTARWPNLGYRRTWAWHTRAYAGRAVDSHSSSYRPAVPIHRSAVRGKNSRWAAVS